MSRSMVTVDPVRNAALTLINSEHRRDGKVVDMLSDEEWVDRFLARSNISRPISRSQLLALRELRALLCKLAEQLTAKQTVSDHALEELNDFLEPLTVQDSVLRAESGSFVRKSVFTGHAAPAAVVAHDFLKLLVDGDWRRLKVCANETCRWAFYDESRNRVRIWCDSSRCGNVMKVRRFRERNHS